MSAPSRRFPRVLLAAAAAALLIVLCAGEAWAAGLTPATSATLLGATYGYGVITDDFADVANTSLDTTTDACGDTWRTLGGTMAVRAGQVVAATSYAASYVIAQEPLCAPSGWGPNEEVSADLRVTGSSHIVGLVLNAWVGGPAAVGAVYDHSTTPATIALWRADAFGAISSLVPATAVAKCVGVCSMRFVYLNGTYTVYWSNDVTTMAPTSVVSCTLDATTRAAVEPYRGVGFAFSGDTASTVDTFMAYPR